ncbi:MAG: cobalamin-dependent protein, partial [Bryobacteraceae bacterium]
MRVLLVSANTERTAIIPLPLGLAFVAAACRRAGHETALLDLMSERDAIPAIQTRIEEFRPGVIGISVRNIDDQNMARPKFLLPAVREIVAVCRRRCDVPIVLGGPGYSLFPESVLRFLQADMGIRGEGEKVFPALLERLESGSDPHGLPGVYLPGHP